MPDEYLSLLGDRTFAAGDVVATFIPAAGLRKTLEFPLQYFYRPTILLSNSSLLVHKGYIDVIFRATGTNTIDDASVIDTGTGLGAEFSLSEPQQQV